LIDLALGGGWPIKIIPSSITMDVDYIKVLK